MADIYIRDPEELMTCPFDPVHRIKAKRFQHHLMKCREKNAKFDIVSCPFNATHQIRRKDLVVHLKTCCDRHLSRDEGEESEKKIDQPCQEEFRLTGNCELPEYPAWESKILNDIDESWDDPVGNPILLDNKNLSSASKSSGAMLSEANLKFHQSILNRDPKLSVKNYKDSTLVKSLLNDATSNDGDGHHASSDSHVFTSQSHGDNPFITSSQNQQRDILYTADDNNELLNDNCIRSSSKTNSDNFNYSQNAKSKKDLDREIGVIPKPFNWRSDEDSDEFD